MRKDKKLLNALNRGFLKLSRWYWFDRIPTDPEKFDVFSQTMIPCLQNISLLYSWFIYVSNFFLCDGFCIHDHIYLDKNWHTNRSNKGLDRVHWSTLSVTVFFKISHWNKNLIGSFWMKLDIQLSFSKISRLSSLTSFDRYIVIKWRPFKNFLDVTYL